MEPVAYPEKPDAIRRNTERWLPILDAAQRVEEFNVPGARTTYKARVAVVGHRDLLTVLGDLTWLGRDTFQPELAWLRSLTPDQLDRWVVILPYQTRTTTLRTILGRGPYSMFERQRSNTGSFQVFSESRHRNAALRIAGIPTNPEVPDPTADSLNSGRTGAVVLYPVIQRGTLDGDPDGPIDLGKVTMATYIVTPLSTTPTDGKLIKWVTIDRLNPSALVVDAK